ncbi:GTPase Era [Alkalitalea saponilacus]|uniref:GTPase Era n=1 Tax=Alkalitalea saponilacus TaxID=889453 RepID=A0A1T5HTV3_9BACT|nr:GTPase Era [Alkalitalea saponilacus]ASB48489.1 GTPase Era [Alkalitalea saponilacus]SKC24096.1 GTP-binding protein Era [Alkalitalea saponilacus]
MAHKSGFVSIVGNPNVGKSTLMNLMVGERLSIITSKAQTTRHKIIGIVNTEDYQVVFSDTPGVLEPNYKLQESMLKFSKSALVDADVILYITDTVETAGKNQNFIDEVNKSKVPVLLAINKIDLADQGKLEALADKWKELLPKSEIFPISALHKFNADNLFKRILDLMPESPPFFDKDALTDKPERFFVSEIIREKILLYYQKEIPYSVEVSIESFKEREKQTEISANIHVARDSQKGIIIGHQGKALKKLGTEARKDIETFLDKKVYLQLYVKVAKNWRDQDNMLKQFGYDG